LQKIIQQWRSYHSTVYTHFTNDLSNKHQYLSCPSVCTITSSYISVATYYYYYYYYVYGLDDWCSIPGRCSDGIFSLHHCIQMGSGAHPASYPVDSGGYYPRHKAARA
jgi:hypothetical protein